MWSRFVSVLSSFLFVSFNLCPFALSRSVVRLGAATTKKKSERLFLLFVWPVHSKYNNHDYCCVMKVFFILYYIIRLFVFILISIRIDTYELSRFDFFCSLSLAAEPLSLLNTHYYSELDFFSILCFLLLLPLSFDLQHQDEPIRICCGMKWLTMKIWKNFKYWMISCLFVSPM